MAEDKPVRDDYDRVPASCGCWKEAMVAYLPDFFALLFPHISKDVDWSNAPVFLDTQLRQMEREANLGRREADALIEVHRLDGEEARVLVHIEVQAQQDPGLPLRMFISHYRIFDMFHKPVCSLAILADKSKSWRPSSFTNELWGTPMSFQFRPENCKTTTPLRSWLNWAKAQTPSLTWWRPHFAPKLQGLIPRLESTGNFALSATSMGSDSAKRKSDTFSNSSTGCSPYHRHSPQPSTIKCNNSNRRITCRTSPVSSD